MRAITIDNPGPQSRLVIKEYAIPICGKEQILVRVKAAAVNRADLMQRQGKYPPPLGETSIPGLEIAGEVVEVGSEVKQFAPGQRVYGLVAGGAYADYCCVHHTLAAPIPNDWDFNYAAAIPEALVTSHATVFSLGNLKQGQTLLIHAAGSGLSTFVIQMTRLIDAQVITTASTHEKMAKAKNLGANTVINYREDDFAEIIPAQSLDLVVDFIGGLYFHKHINLLKTKGKLVQIACMQGHRVDCDLALLMKKRLQIMGFVLRSQSIKEKAILWQDAHKLWLPYLLNKRIVPVIDSEFGFTAIENAHNHMQNSAHFGKIVINFEK